MFYLFWEKVDDDKSILIVKDEGGWIQSVDEVSIDRNSIQSSIDNFNQAYQNLSMDPSADTGALSIFETVWFSLTGE